MLLRDYDVIQCLIVDHRWATDRERVAAMVRDEGAEVQFYVDGRLGMDIPYDQRELKVPANWPLSVPAYYNFCGIRGIIQHAKDIGARNVLVMEDDCLFTPEFGAVVRAATTEMRERGIQWDLLYYGSIHKWSDTVDLTEHVMRVNGSNSTHCFGVTSKLFDVLLGMPPDYATDHMIKVTTHSKYNVLAIWPNVALQKPCLSIIDNEYRDYTEWFGVKGRNR